jgi:hypothetical protein
VGCASLIWFYTGPYCVSLCFLQLYPVSYSSFGMHFFWAKWPFSFACFTLFCDIGYFTNNLLPYSFTRVGRLQQSQATSVCSEVEILGITTTYLFMLPLNMSVCPITWFVACYYLIAIFFFFLVGMMDKPFLSFIFWETHFVVFSLVWAHTYSRTPLLVGRNRGAKLFSKVHKQLQQIKFHVLVFSFQESSIKLSFFTSNELIF